jgi:hypothetical protein
MSSHKVIKRVLISLAAASAVAIALLMAVQAQAGGSDTLSVDSADAEPGDQVTVSVTADISSDPGLGAWTVDVIVDNPDQVSIVDCEAGDGNSVCNAQYADDTVRFAGASADGLTGAVFIGAITLECANSEGSSDLLLDTTGFADATLGDPQEIPVIHNPGTVTCEEEGAAPTRRPRATATPRALPPTGTGGDTSDAMGQLIAALAGVGLASIGGYGLLRFRARR